MPGKRHQNDVGHYFLLRVAAATVDVSAMEELAPDGQLIVASGAKVTVLTPRGSADHSPPV